MSTPPRYARRRIDPSAADDQVGRMSLKQLRAAMPSFGAADGLNVVPLANSHGSAGSSGHVSTQEVDS